MGTKNNPGKFDCHEAADPDEPMFTLLARDKLAPFLVSIWGLLRQGDWEAAQAVYDGIFKKEAAVEWLITPDVDKAQEAIECSHAMFAWREANR